MTHKNPLRDGRRSYATDGQYAYLRRRKASQASKDRVDAKVRAGEYRHLRTDDDVEVYEISEGSPLKRKRKNLTEYSIPRIEAEIVRSGTKRDWVTYYDACAELAYRFKNSEFPLATSHTMLQSTMRYLHQRILRRGGPSEFEIGNALKSVRTKRSGTQIYLTH